MNFLRRQLLQRASSVRTEPPAPDVPSPCVAVCRMDEASGLCEGCLRSLDEIAAWATLSAPERRTVWTRIEQRAAREEAA